MSAVKPENSEDGADPKDPEKSLPQVGFSKLPRGGLDQTISTICTLVCVGLAVYRAHQGRDDVGLLMIVAATIAALPYLERVSYGKFVATFREDLKVVAKDAQMAKKESTAARESASKAVAGAEMAKDAVRAMDSEQSGTADGIAPAGGEAGSSAKSGKSKSPSRCPSPSELRAKFEDRYKGDLDDDEADHLSGRGTSGRANDSALFAKYGISVQISSEGDNLFLINVSARPPKPELLGDRAYILMHPTFPKRWWSCRSQNGEVKFHRIHAWGSFTCLLYFCPEDEFVEINLDNPDFFDRRDKAGYRRFRSS